MNLRNCSVHCSQILLINQQKQTLQLKSYFYNNPTVLIYCPAHKRLEKLMIIYHELKKHLETLQIHGEFTSINTKSIL